MRKTKKIKKKRKLLKMKTLEKLAKIWLQDGTGLQKSFFLVINMIQKLMYGALVAS